MAKYLIKGSYTAEGLRGLIAGGGGTTRREAVSDLMASVGGSLDALYYAFGGDDIYAIVDAPDRASAAAAALTVGAAGGFRCETVVLMEPEEIDQAVKKTPSYRPPGS